MKHPDIEKMVVKSNTCQLRLKFKKFRQWGPVDQKFQIEGVAPSNYSSSQKTRVNDLSYDIKIWTDLFSVLSQPRV